MPSIPILPLSPVLACVFILVAASVGSVLPLSPTEPALIAIAAVSPPGLMLPLIIAATVGHMSGKALVYVGSQRAGEWLPAKYAQAMERARPRMARRRRSQYLMVAVSGMLGLPPFYGVTVLCGVLRIPFAGFVLAGSVGRGLRFGALVAMPTILRAVV